jgi:hypothetical protein
MSPFKDIKTMESLQSYIEYARLEIERLKLDNERLRLLNANMVLRSQSQDRIDENVVETPMTLETLEEEVQEEIQEPKEDEETQKILDYDFIGSSILSCSINKNPVNEKELKYTRIARKIWELTPRQIIYDSSTFNSKDYYYSKHSYKWIYEIQLSMQIGNTKEILNEILHMCKLMNYELKMNIQLVNGYKLDINVSKGTNGATGVSYQVTELKQVLKVDKVLYSNYYGW